MASPWKLFAGWVSPRLGKVKPGSSSKTGPVRALIPPPQENGPDVEQDPIVLPAVDVQQAVRLSDDLPSPQAEPADASVGELEDIPDFDGSPVSGPAHEGLVGENVHETSSGPPAAQVSQAGTGQRSAKVRAATNVATLAADVPPPAGDTLTLDQEINLLRRQLADRLKLQNAQLRQMLERFKH